MITESFIDTKKIWYFGNNRSKKLKIEHPSWNSPFFLTDSLKYAIDYQDYGVWKVVLNDSIKSQICDFYSDADVKRLNWPKVVVDQIRSGKTDFNAIALDMWILANEPDEKLWHVDRSDEWLDAALFFQEHCA